MSSIHLSNRASKKNPKQILNKTHSDVFLSNHDCRTLAADRELSTCEVTDASFDKPRRKSGGVVITELPLCETHVKEPRSEAFPQNKQTAYGLQRRKI